jgi:hypothetical protein
MHEVDGVRAVGTAATAEEAVLGEEAREELEVMDWFACTAPIAS